MNIAYIYFRSIPDHKVLNDIIKLHKDIFGSVDNLINRMESKPHLLINIALDNDKLIGYKIGYALDHDKFYSWLGGVDANYRNYGVATNLMEQQQQFLRDNGYQSVQTKTKNKWRSMLILNIKKGFDVIGVYTDDKSEKKILLEKKLL